MNNWGFIFVTATVLALTAGGCAAPTQEAPNGPLDQAMETTSPVARPEPSPFASPANTAALETAEPVEAAPTIELPVDKYADKDTLAKAIVEDRVTAWHMAGATEEKQESYYKRPQVWTQADYAAEAEKESIPYIESLFTDDWSSRPETVKFIQRMKDMNAQTMYLNAATGKFSTDPDNLEAYAISLNVTSVTELTSTDGNRLLEITFDAEDNSEKNTALKAVRGTIEHTNATWQLELKQEGSVYKIANAAL